MNDVSRENLPMDPFLKLDSKAILETLDRLERRIEERFPGSGLGRVSRDLIAVGRHAEQRSMMIARPNIALRAAVIVAVVAGISGLFFVGAHVQFKAGNHEIFGVFQGVEALFNIVILVATALFFALSLELRIKRKHALRDLHTFRSIAHVIDMHQLTKDPTKSLYNDRRTASSPARNMDSFDLTRYLDYCSELLSLTGKIAALYAQNLPDFTILETVNDIEELTLNLSQKIWQKINILERQQALHYQPKSKRD